MGLGVSSLGLPRPLESRATSGDSEMRPSSPLLTSGGPPGPPGPSPGWGRAGDLVCPLPLFRWQLRGLQKEPIRECGTLIIPGAEQSA